MGQIVSLPEDHHLETQLLLPWYATGRIEAADRAIVEAHLVDCALCRAELESDHALRDKIEEASSDAEQSWEALAARLSPAPLPARSPARHHRGLWPRLRQAASRPTNMRWAIAAQLVLIVGLGGVLFIQPQATPAAKGEYRALGDAPAGRAANVLAMFRPETTEADLRRLLQASGARLVDGPTSADAYLLDVPGGENGGGLASLRNDSHVTMAEIIEQAPAE